MGSQQLSHASSWQAMRATGLRHRDATALPPIRATIVAGENDVGVRISDQGWRNWCLGEMICPKICRRWTIVRIDPIAFRSVLVFSRPECDEDGCRPPWGPADGEFKRCESDCRRTGRRRASAFPRGQGPREQGWDCTTPTNRVRVTHEQHICNVGVI